MIEEIIYKYLNENMSVDVFSEHPKNEPDSYVIFERIGGEKRNQVKSAIFAFQSYAKTMKGAAKLNEELKLVLENLATLDEIAFVRLNNDYNFTDTSTKMYRYQAVFDIKHY